MCKVNIFLTQILTKLNKYQLYRALEALNMREV